MEIERKYLVDRLPDSLAQYPHHEIEQGYLCIAPTVRIRKIDQEYWLTIKEKLPSGSTAIHNREEEFRLSEETYNKLKDKCEYPLIRKTRYRIPISGLTAELDIFHDRYEGLKLVEVEFSDTESADNFSKPQWFGLDVSTDPHYSNSYLASHTA